MYEFIEVIKMNGMVASDIEKTLNGYRVSLPLHGRLIRYTANRFKIIQINDSCLYNQGRKFCR